MAIPNPGIQPMSDKVRLFDKDFSRTNFISPENSICLPKYYKLFNKSDKKYFMPKNDSWA